MWYLILVTAHKKNTIKISLFGRMVWSKPNLIRSWNSVLASLSVSPHHFHHFFDDDSVHMQCIYFLKQKGVAIISRRSYIKCQTIPKLQLSLKKLLLPVFALSTKHILLHTKYIQLTLLQFWLGVLYHVREHVTRTRISRALRCC